MQNKVSNNSMTIKERKSRLESPNTIMEFSFLIIIHKLHVQKQNISWKKITEIISTTYARKLSLHRVLQRFREGEARTEMGRSFHNLGKETKTE